MKYKLLIIDIDGTLVDKNGNISAEDSNALAKASAAGIQVSLSTGRAAQACTGIISRLSLDGYHIFFDGALIGNPVLNSEIYVQPLDKTVLKHAIEFARSNDIDLELHSATHYFVEKETRITDIRRQFFDIQPTVAEFTGIWHRERIIKGGLAASSPRETAKFNSFQLEFNNSLHFSWAKTPAYPDIDFINIVDPGVSKGNALEVLVSYLGISLDEVIAIGDGTNDIPLFSHAGMSIAMQNAPDEVKAAADYITADIDHSGVAAAINKFLL